MEAFIQSTPLFINVCIELIFLPQLQTLVREVYDDFIVESAIVGHHVSKLFWIPVIKKELSVSQDGKVDKLFIFLQGNELFSDRTKV